MTIFCPNDFFSCHATWIISTLHTFNLPTKSPLSISFNTFVFIPWKYPVYQYIFILDKMNSEYQVCDITSHQKKKPTLFVHFSKSSERIIKVRVEGSVCHSREETGEAEHHVGALLSTTQLHFRLEQQDFPIGLQKLKRVKNDCTGES